MKRNGIGALVIVPLLSIIISFLIGCMIIAALGANPADAMRYLLKGSFGNMRNIGTTLSRATPLIFTTLCACFAYRCGVFNLGGEGQFIIGAIVACYIATKAPFTGFPAIVLCALAGAAGVGLWAAIAGVLKVWRGQNEMIITIMLNYVATLLMGVVYTNWLRDGSVPQTVAVPDETQLASFFGLRATVAFPVAVIAGIVLFYFLFYTSSGFQLRAVGLNMTAAKVNRRTRRST